MSHPRPKRATEGRRWRRMVAQIVARDMGRCWICGHYGAHSADHVVPVTEDESREWDTTNLRAAHAHPKACVQCTIAAGKPVYCNSIKGGYSVERARRIIAERTGLRMPTGDRPEPRQDEPEGRL